MLCAKDAIFIDTQTQCKVAREIHSELESIERKELGLSLLAYSPLVAGIITTAVFAIKAITDPIQWIFVAGVTALTALAMYARSNNA